MSMSDDRAVSRRVVIVGASVAGLTTAETLRASGFAGEIVLIGAEDRLPYSRPPLSKQVLLGEWMPERSQLRTSAELAGLGIQLRLGTPATALDLAAREVVMGADRMGFDLIVIATGVAPRSLEVAERGAIRSLRTVDDARTLRDDLQRAHRIVVVGGGVLGSEIASAARRMGRHATLVGRSRSLTLGATGALLSPRLIALHSEHGVDLRLGQQVAAVDRSGHEHHVMLGDGTEVPGDLVVAAVGGAPNTDWLRGSGLTLADGVVCDGTGLAAPDVYAVGDVARWMHPSRGGTHRVEHQANAIGQALCVAEHIATGSARLPALPFFWAEIHGVRIQAYGSFDASAPLVPIDEDGAQRVVLGSFSGGMLTGVVGWNAPSMFRSARARLDAEHATIERMPHGSR
jgi:NADPH-dependent 2,4-dienoyl-CoA reductase/sulfur reductase-like enzyme